MTVSSAPAVYDLLDSPDCLPDLLQGSLKSQGRDEAFLLSSFRLQSRASTPLYSIVHPKDGSKYLELSVQAKLSKGGRRRPASASLAIFWSSLALFSAASDTALPEIRRPLCHHQLQPGLPGGRPRPSRDAPRQRPPERAASPQHLSGLQAGSHRERPAGCVWGPPAGFKHGGTQVAANSWPGERVRTHVLTTAFAI